jgi:hypothetical protein
LRTVSIIDPAPPQPRLVACDIDHEIIDLQDLVRSERRRAPVELAHPCVQLGGDNRHQHEIIEADRKIQRRQPSHGHRDQDRHLHERTVVAQPLDRLVRTSHIVASLDDDNRGRLLGDRVQIEPTEVETAERGSATELGQQAGDRGGFIRLGLTADHDNAHGRSDLFLAGTRSSHPKVYFTVLPV